MLATRLRPIHRRTVVVATLVATALLVPVSPVSAGSLREQNSVAAQPSASGAGPIPLASGEWTVFEFGDRGSVSRRYSFFSSTPILLRVTDASCRGDEFTVFDRGFRIFKTTEVATDPSCDDVPESFRGRQCWLDPSYSKGKFLLEPGFHRIKIRVRESPFGGGGAFLRIDPKPVQ